MSESPTHPDAPRAGGETPTPQERYERLLAEKLKWFEEAAASDRALHALTDDATLSEALGEIRHFAPAAMHWALNLAMSRLLARHRDGERWRGLVALLDRESMRTPEPGTLILWTMRSNQWDAPIASIQSVASRAPARTLWIEEAETINEAMDRVLASPSPERASK